MRVNNELTLDFASNKKELQLYSWFRIVLDEAHYIKGRTIQIAKAVYQLEGLNRWCLSGTPIQNKLNDLFSLIHFIKLEPWFIIAACAFIKHIFNNRSDYLYWDNYINKPYEKNNDPIIFEIL